MYIASACLCGINCRYDGKGYLNQKVIDLLKDGKIIPICPEQLAGLTTPRIPIEKKGNKIIDKEGNDYTDKLINGINESMKIVNNINIKGAFLKSKSPTCGYGKVYDGNFSGNLIEGNGLFTEKLIEKGINIESCN